jgi:hypothetical protein
MVSTCKSNANAHPGLVVASNRKRHTKEQIQADEARTKADAISNREAILAREREILARIGAAEDYIQQEDSMLQAHAKRPDLRPGPPSFKQKCPGPTPKKPVNKTATPKNRATENDDRLVHL